MTDRATAVVVGPRTRLGRELIVRARARGEEVVAIARHDRDVDLLEQEYGADPGVRVRLASHARSSSADRGAREVYRDAPESPPVVECRPRNEVGVSKRPDAPHESGASSDAPRAPHDLTAPRIWICALGPVQSEDRVDPETVEQELADLAALITPGCTVVLVSTVLVLAPTPERRYYAGWKSLVEARVRSIAAARGAHLSVLQPGRLVGRPAQQNLSDFVHTPYPKLARVVEACNSTKPSVRTVGLDARVWVLIRGARVASVALTGRSGRADESGDY